MAQEDRHSSYWSYVIPNQRVLGWVSIYEDNGELLLSASIEFGVLKQGHSARGLLALLEANSSLPEGLAFSTLLNSLVNIRFLDDMKFLTPERLMSQLQELHCVAKISIAKFINPEFQIEPLPIGWFVEACGET